MIEKAARKVRDLAARRRRPPLTPPPQRAKVEIGEQEDRRITREKHDLKRKRAVATRVQQAYNKAAMFMCAMGFSGGFLPKSNPHSDYMLAVTLGAGAIFATILAYLGCVASQAPPPPPLSHAPAPHTYNHLSCAGTGPASSARAS